MAQFEDGMMDISPCGDTSAGVEETVAAQPTRRQFFGRTLAAASGVAFSSLLAAPEAQAACDPIGEELEIFQVTRGADGTLRSILELTNELRQIPTAATSGETCAEPLMFRCFHVLDASGKVIWPRKPGVPRPGPIYSAEVGDTVEITFLNHVNENQVSGSVDFGDPERVMARDPATGKMVMLPEHPQWGCDTAKLGGKTTIPFADAYPDCFHGSNAANMHFHGTHVTPEAFGDNVLVQVEPDLSVTLPQTVTAFLAIFAQVKAGQYSHGPVDWDKAIPKDWKDRQSARLAYYDNHHQFEGKMLKAWGLSLAKINQDAIAHHEWPPYQMGAFPYAFTLTKYDPGNPDGPEMGQAPGTHWYHAHKHGSTTMHLLHGLAGVFVIKGQYDKDLQAFYNNALTEKIMIMQEFAPTPNLYAPGRPARSLLVNGQLQPKITMAQGEVQLWRIVNGAMQAPMTITFPASVVVHQIAQDGVQFRVENFQRNLTQSSFVMSPGNRIDVLLQASGTGVVTYNGGPASGGGNLVSVAIVGSKPMQLPTQANYPVTKVPFLDDIDPSTVRNKRRLTFSWEDGRTGGGQNPNPPHFLIDGKQFEEGTIYQSMTLGQAEEWTIENATSMVHPFHIHVNPFQVFEVMNPNTPGVITAADYPLFQNPTPGNQAQRDALLKRCLAPIQPPFVWWDTRAIPMALVDSSGNLVLTKPGGPAALPGYFRMRSRFVDFTGKFVLHCHILGHEDRGMMQLVEVSDRKTTAKHH
ncbi:MAG TPA: multicopper oxidase domain-containing protein [Bryobacteraceae bacterium]